MTTGVTACRLGFKLKLGHRFDILTDNTNKKDENMKIKPRITELKRFTFCRGGDSLS